MGLWSDLNAPNLRNTGRWSDHAQGGFGLMALLVATLFLAAYCPVHFMVVRPDKKHTKLYEQVHKTADLFGPNPKIRGNKITEHEEWAWVYRELGLTYDERVSNPREDLSTTQFKEYLSLHR